MRLELVIIAFCCFVLGLIACEAIQKIQDATPPPKAVKSNVFILRRAPPPIWPQVKVDI